MPSDKILKQKQAVVAQLTDKIKGAMCGVLVDYKGINVADDTKLRAGMRKAGVDYAVVKNTLTRLAMRGAGFDGFDEVLNGTTAMAVSSTDLVAPAKLVAEFSQKNDKFRIKGGFIEGRQVSADEIKILAKLPPKEQLIAKVLGGFNAPIAGFAGVLRATMTGLVVALGAIAEKQSA